MVDVVLLAGRLLLLALLYLFLFAAIRAGIGLVRGRGVSVSHGLALAVVQGPKEIQGTKVPISGPVVIGRSPGADIVIADDFVSGSHARVAPSGGDGATLEDLQSTNGTVLGSQRVYGPTKIKAGDVITIGKVKLRVEKA
ncbi:MAG: FHA domain-containing protein [Coriobacteriales bacterium]|nr:FHA domain-containing protein [Coriobacteriales bacterium]